MLAINFSTARENFKAFCDRVNDEIETVVITRKQGGNVVLISEAEYNNIQENLFVRRNPEAYVRLMKSIKQLKEGKGTVRELLDE
jgi:antitoxin YefM